MVLIVLLLSEILLSVFTVAILTESLCHKWPRIWYVCFSKITTTPLHLWQHWTFTWVTWQIPIVKQDMPTLQEHMSSLTVLVGSCCSIFSVLGTIVCPFILCCCCCFSGYCCVCLSSIHSCCCVCLSSIHSCYLPVLLFLHIGLSSGLNVRMKV